MAGALTKRHSCNRGGIFTPPPHHRLPPPLAPPALPQAPAVPAGASVLTRDLIEARHVCARPSPAPRSLPAAARSLLLDAPRRPRDGRPLDRGTRGRDGPRHPVHV